MPDFQPHVVDWDIAEQQVQELKVLLDGSADIDEKEFDGFFEPRTQLRGLFGLLNPDVALPDLLAWQYPIFGDFRCDFAIGDSGQHAYTFVEYEDAEPKSLFVKQSKKATRAWSPRFDGGYSQIVDWFYKLQTMTDTPDMEARFNKRSIFYSGVLVIGRDQYMQAGESMRLAWRRDHVVVNSKRIFCYTYDQLVERLLVRIQNLSGARKTRK